MGGDCIDTEIGNIYNAWEIIGYNAKKYKYICKCQCGTVREIQLSFLKNKITKSCGCSSYFNLLSTKIGRLTIDSLYDTYNNRKRMLCKCECGNEKVIALADLKKKNPTQSCGCIRKEIIEKIKTYGENDLTGKVFGKWKVLKYIGSSKWLCECECGNQNEINTGTLNSGESKSSGKCYENTIDKYFFDSIDTQEKAYILGLLYADGYNNEIKKLIRLDLQEGDKDILYKIKNTMHYKGEIRFYQNANKSFRITGTDKEYSCKPTARLLIHNIRLSEQLSLKGCTNNKTYILAYPRSDILPNCLNRHFIRRLIDGDGSIGYQIIKNKYSTMKKFLLTLTGTTEIVSTIADLLKCKFNCTPDIRSRYPDRDNNNVTMSICGNRVIENIFSWIYEESTIHIDRKYNKYLELVDQNKTIDNRTVHDLKGIYTPRQVHNLVTNEVYESCAYAARKLNVSSRTITTRCKSRNSFIIYEDDFLKLSDIDKNKLLYFVKLKYQNKLFA